MKKLLSFLVGLVLFVLIPILGWGISDFSNFITNSYRMTFVIMMSVLSLLVVILVPNEGRGFGEGNKLIKRQKITILILQIVPILINFLSPYFDRNNILTFNYNDIVRIFGLVLTFTGFFFMNWSIIVLGKQFSVNVTVQDNHKLITKCPYNIIRHPRYLGIILFLIGIPITFTSLIPLILDVPVIGVLLWRIKDEEKLMRQEFNAEWDSYMKSTYSLIPYIY